MVVSPDERASLAGADVLAEGGNALEASVTVAAVLAVVYPHMNGLGGDSFWLTARLGQPPRVIDASGGAAVKADADFFRARGHSTIPARGPLAANTVAASVAGGNQLDHGRGGRLPWTDCSRRTTTPSGAAVAGHLAETAAQSWATLREVPGFVAQFGDDQGGPPEPGDTLRLPALAETLGESPKPESGPSRRPGGIDRQRARGGQPVAGIGLAAHRVVEPAPVALDTARGGSLTLARPPKVWRR